MSSEAKEQEVNQLLLELKRLTENDRERIATYLSSLFSKNDEYFEIVMQRLNRALSESNDLEERRTALLVICSMPDVLYDFQRTNLINKFHSPVFKLMETNTEESLLERIGLAYERLIALGGYSMFNAGNKNDTAIESNLNLALDWIKSTTAKEIKKAAALVTIRILLVETPYTTFKKLFQKDNSLEKENYVLLSSVSRSRNIRVRVQYLRFFEYFVKHIAQRRDANFHHSYFKRFYSDVMGTRGNRDYYNVHIILEGVRILLMYAENIFTDPIYTEIIEYINERKSNNKNATIQKSLISIIPVISTIPKSQILTPLKQDIFFDFLKYLKGIVGEDKVEAYRAIFDIIQAMKSADIEAAVINEFKLIVLSIKTHLRERTDKTNLLQRREMVIVKCMHSIILKLKKERTEANFSREELDELVTLVLLQGIYEYSVRFVHELAKLDVYGLSDLIEKKLITVVSKILTSHYKRFMDNDIEMESFKVELDKIAPSAQFRSEENRIDAIRSLSVYKFKEQYMGVVSTFVRDKIIKHYLEWKIGDTRKAAVEAAFLLYAKKGKRVAMNQMTEILEKILNVGMSDPDEEVKKTVFNCLKKNLSAEEGFSEFLNVQSHFRKLFACLKDRSIIIQNITLEILCRLSHENPSDIVPFLKKTLYQHLRSLAKMEQSNFHEKKNILKLIRCIIQHGTSIIEAHTPAICRIMIAYLRDKQHAQVLSEYIFKTFQVLAEHLAFSTRPYVDDLSQFQLEAMQDKLNSKKRSIAVKSFIAVIRNCGFVILPYCKFPNLLPTIVYLVKGGIDTDGRLDLLKILGGLGAIDRFKFKVMSKVYYDYGDRGIQYFMTDSKTNCYYLNNEKLAREKEQTDNPINELKHYYEDLIVLGISSKKQEALTAPKPSSSNRLPARNKEKYQAIPSRDINELTINSLLRILEDPSLIKKHALTIEALNRIVDILGTALYKYTKNLIPRLLKLSSENSNVMKVVLVVTQNCNLGDYIDDVLKYVVSSTSNIYLIEVSLDILEIFAYKFRSSLRHSLEAIIHLANKHIKSKISKKVILKIFSIYKHLEDLLDPHIHLIVPFFCESFLTTVSDLTDEFLELLVSFSQRSSSTIEYLKPITQYLVTLLQTAANRKELAGVTRSKIINTFVAFVLIFKYQFVVYLPLIHQTVQSGPENGLYNKCMRYVQNHTNLEQITDFFSQDELLFILNDNRQPFLPKQENQRLTKKPEGLYNLINEFDPTQKNQIDEDWNEWLRKTSLELLKKSPSPVLKSCASLAEEYLELAAELYNVAFLEIWRILQSDQKHKMIYHIKRVLNTNPPPPLNVRQTILNLTEFMGRQNFFSELYPYFLAKAAKDALAYAKTLYFCEQLFELNPERQMEVLIEIYTLLGQPESAAGLLKIAKKHKIETKVSWHEKLQHYDEALYYYNKPGNHNQDIVPKIKCVNEMGDWKLVLESCNKLIAENKDKRKDVADLAVNATVNLGKWDQAREWIEHVDSNNENLSFWNAILSIKKEDYDEAERQIKANRLLIYNQISQLLTFSSNHSADSLIRLQQLFELEEIIGIKRYEKSIALKQGILAEQAPDQQIDLQNRITNLKEIWSDRLVGNTRSLVVWQKIVSVRSLMFNKSEELDFWLDFCKLALKEHKTELCKSTLDSIKQELAGKHQNNRVVELELLELEYKYKSGIIKEEDAIKRVEHFLEKNSDIDNKLKAKMYYKCAIWIRDREEEEISAGRTDQILELIGKSTLLNPKLIKGWHLLGVMYSEVMQNSRSETYPKNALLALKAFFKSLEFGTSTHKYFLQDCLKLMTLVFEYSEDRRIADEFIASFRRVMPEGWIEVIPQIIARLYNKNKRTYNLSNLLRELLLYVGEQHPQALIYPLIFASKSKTKDRREPALAILKRIQEREPDICLQAELISTYLGKAAIKLKYFWHDGIDAAWKIYDETKNISEVVKMLKELHESDLEQPMYKKSNSEISFHQEFGLELREAYQWLLRFERTGEVICFSQAFEIYFSVYRRIKYSFENLKKVYLKNVAPVLLSVSDCKLSMPGLYQPNKPVVRIQGFHNELAVLQSKQRPRKLLIYGSDGKEYTFLLKGRYDLRLDERVMQLLALVNKLLGLNHSTLKKDLFVTRYSIIPLSVNTGLIGWVYECDTLNYLIKEYRTEHKIRPDVEKNLYEKCCDEYTQLPMINKVEIFRHVLYSTQGLDLAKVLWLKSANSEAWIERRTCYTRSLATMSMVGYILGLGDRHPSNIMIQRKTGRIVHIDFGDCFEVAMLRDKFPEKVPFRLTRMLQKAMEVCGIEGNYKSTCYTVMNVLRSNKYSLLIVLYAFLYDPIISWKLNVYNAPKNEAPVVAEDKQQDHPFPEDKPDNSEMIMSMMEAFSTKYFKYKTELEYEKKPEQTPGRFFKLDNEPPEFINQKAIYALERIRKKLYGRDFDDSKILNVEEQVKRLIKEAMSYENICQSWIGWCPFW